MAKISVESSKPSNTPPPIVGGHIPVRMAANDRPDLAPSFPDPDCGVTWGNKSDFQYEQNLNGKTSSNQPSGSGSPTVTNDTKYKEETRVEAVPTGPPTYRFHPFTFVHPATRILDDNIYSELDCIHACEDTWNECFNDCPGAPPVIPRIVCVDDCRRALDACLLGCEAEIDEDMSTHLNDSGDLSSTLNVRWLESEYCDLGDENIKEFVGVHASGAPIVQPVTLHRKLTLSYM